MVGLRWGMTFVVIYLSSHLANCFRGGVGTETSAAYIGPEFERIFYKLNYGYRAAIQNLYMVSHYSCVLISPHVLMNRLDIWRYKLGKPGTPWWLHLV